MYKILACGLLIVLVLSPAAMATNGMEMIGYGARSAGLGGAGSAVGDGAVSLAQNPAALSLVGVRQFDLGFSVLAPVLHFRNGLNNKAGNRDTHQAFYGFFPMPMFAYAQPLASRPGLSWGAGLFVPGGMGADYGLVHELWPEGVSYHSMLMYAKLMAGASYRITPRLSVGIGLNVGFGWMDIWQPFATSPDFAQGSTDKTPAKIIAPTYGQVFQRMGYDEVTCLFTMRQATAFGVGADVGLLYEVNRWISVGVTYTSPMQLKWHARSTLDMTRQFLAAAEGFGVPLELASLGFGLSPEAGMVAHPDVEFQLDWPQKAGLGVAVRPVSRLLVAFDFTWINWSATMDVFEMKFSSLDNPNFIKMVGADGCVRSVALNWEDQFVFAVGAAYRIGHGITLRTGYNFGNNPVPGNTAMPTFPALVEHHVALGLGKSWGRFEINTAFEMALKKNLGTNESLTARTLNNSRNELSEYIFHVTFTWKGKGEKKE